VNFRIIVLISGHGSNLQAIIDAITHKKVAAEIAAVISSCKDAYGLRRAIQANIPQHVISKHDHPDPERYDTALAEIINRYHADLIVLAGYMRILTPAFVQRFQGKIINIHPSLLPKYRGLNTHQRVLDAGETEHGVTIHYVTDNLDAGPIIAQQALTIKPGETAAELKQRIQAIEHQLYPQVIAQLAQQHEVL